MCTAYKRARSNDCKCVLNSQWSWSKKALLVMSQWESPSQTTSSGRMSDVYLSTCAQDVLDIFTILVILESIISF